MIKYLSMIIVFISLIISGCFTSQKVIVPLSVSPVIEDTYTIIWNGISKAYRYIDGDWRRAESYDYVFDVIQKRYPDTWKSIKSLHRLHPEYDGKAGMRSQTMYFELKYDEDQNNELRSTISSSLGQGIGSSDIEFRNQTLSIKVKDISRFAPYNYIRITQQYKYEQGILEEVVELFEKKGEEEIPFMKMEEKAYFYLRSKLDDPPTKWK